VTAYVEYRHGHDGGSVGRGALARGAGRQKEASDLKPDPGCAVDPAPQCEPAAEFDR